MSELNRQIKFYETHDEVLWRLHERSRTTLTYETWWQWRNRLCELRQELREVSDD